MTNGRRDTLPVTGHKSKSKIGVPMRLVRRARSSDLDEVFTLACDFATSFRPDIETFSRSFLHLIVQDDDLLLVSEDSDQLIAYLSGFDHYALFANGRVAWIEEIMVRADRRREGHGKALIAQFEKWASLRGSKFVALATRRASAFYLALGYERSASYFRKLL
jgi:GNAT superfamily N-acetyltransferase